MQDLYKTGWGIRHQFIVGPYSQVLLSQSRSRGEDGISMCQTASIRRGLGIFTWRKGRFLQGTGFSDPTRPASWSHHNQIGEHQMIR